MKNLIPILLAACVMPSMAAEPAKPPLFDEVNQLTTKLALDAGFSDDDAVQVAVFFLQNLLGPKTAKEKTSTRIVTSKPESVTVYAGYDNHIITRGFRFQFERGDITNGKRYARFMVLQYVPDA